MVKSDKIMQNSIHHDSLCGLKTFNLGFVARFPPIDPTLYCNKEHAKGVASRPCERHYPSTLLGVLPLPIDPTEGVAPKPQGRLYQKINENLFESFWMEEEHFLICRTFFQGCRVRDQGILGMRIDVPSTNTGTTRPKCDLGAYSPIPKIRAILKPHQIHLDSTFFLKLFPSMKNLALDKFLLSPSNYHFN